MQMRRLRQALVAVIVPAALVGLTVGPAEAAAKAPKLPTPAKVAAAYPHLAGVTPVVVSGAAKPGNCTPAALVKGAKSSAAVYSASAPAAATPSVTVAAIRFKSATKAKAYLKKAAAFIACESQALGFTFSSTAFKFKLKGTDQRVGLTTTQSISGISIAGQTLLARKGEKVVSVTAVSGNATAPAVEPAQGLLKVAVKAAR
ncbi:hypothetical protein ACFFOS_26810 [Nocardioides kongjuensis]|uniref:Sensor domain-containing protein n=1 Tax=Nocardioides kongjuensis TaxID=349522 RepID=A0A852R4E5_9ACTN|nr:hypothetical protein [Nocardioides kongjuensis]NYD28461.1 hypothetical protein [Nocardioides kongjuensis]